MDPNAMLAKIRAEAAYVAANPSEAAVTSRPRELAAMITDLDEWLRKGGFPPAAWIKQPATPQAIPAERDGQTADGRPYKMIENETEPGDLYPKKNAYQFNAWPVLVLETGGYNDIEICNPWNGQKLWIGEIWNRVDDDVTESAALAQALRLIADSIEQSGFSNGFDADV